MTTTNYDKLILEVATGRSLWIDLSPADVVEADGVHCTLLFCGKDTGAVARSLSAATRLATELKPIEARVGGVAVFATSAPEGRPVVHLLQNPLLRTLKTRLLEMMLTYEPGWAPRRDDFDYTPHVTVGRVRDYGEVIPRAFFPEIRSYLFTRLRVCAGDFVSDYPLGGA